MSRSGIDLYDALRSKLVESLVWRQRLPVGEDDERWPAALEQLAEEIGKLLKDPRVVRELLRQEAEAATTSSILRRG